MKRSGEQRTALTPLQRGGARVGEEEGEMKEIGWPPIAVPAHLLLRPPAAYPGGKPLPRGDRELHHGAEQSCRTRAPCSPAPPSPSTMHTRIHTHIRQTHVLTHMHIHTCAQTEIPANTWTYSCGCMYMYRQVHDDKHTLHTHMHT